MVFVSPIAPMSGDGADGDLYYQTAPDGTHIWQKLSGIWVDLGVVGDLPPTPSDETFIIV